MLFFGCSEKKEARLQRFLEKGHEMEARQNYPEAFDYYQEAIDLDSCYADAWNNIGTLQFKQSKLLEALASYNQALFCQQDFTNALYNRARVFYELRNYSNALSDIDRVYKVFPDSSTIHFMRGLIQVGLHEYEHSIESFQKALSPDSMNTEVLAHRALHLLGRRRPVAPPGACARGALGRTGSAGRTLAAAGSCS
jgi:tetratricopeptide (TPR) repeat protein